MSLNGSIAQHMKSVTPKLLSLNTTLLKEYGLSWFTWTKAHKGFHKINYYKPKAWQSWIPDHKLT